MESSVEAGTSRFAYIQGLKSAVKTGTSQVKIAGTHTYAHIGWLIGFAPVQAPKIAFCIMIEQKDLTENFWEVTFVGPSPAKYYNFVSIKALFPSLRMDKIHLNQRNRYFFTQLNFHSVLPRYENLGLLQNHIMS